MCDSTNGVDLLFSLTDDVIGEYILECLCARELLVVTCVNKRLCRLCDNKGLWSLLLVRDFEGTTTPHFGFNLPNRKAPKIVTGSILPRHRRHR